MGQDLLLQNRRPTTPQWQQRERHSWRSRLVLGASAVIVGLWMLWQIDPYSLVRARNRCCKKVGPAAHNHPQIFGARKHHAINWKPCFDNPSVQCATYGVPTNHDDPEEGTTYLSMTKVTASSGSKEKLGSIYTNPGGPGGEGRTLCFNYGEQLRDLAGGKFDIICWDPRGIGRTVPNVNCHGSQLGRRVTLGNAPLLDRTFEVPPNPDSEVGRAVLVAQQNEALGLMQLQANICNQNVGADTLKWMGTTTLIRDIEYLKNKFDGEDAPINFFGGSYGTIVADYLVNMLPDKVGKVVAHGVAGPPTWAQKHFEDYVWLGELLGDSEISYQRWLDTVVANSEAIQQVVRTGEELGKKIDELIGNLYETGGVAIVDDNIRGVLTSGMLRSMIFNAVQVPPGWPKVAEAIAKAIQGDYLPAARLRISPFTMQHPEPAGDGYVNIGQGDLSRLAVSCADAPPYLANESWPTAESMIDGLLKNCHSASHHFGLTVNLMEQHGGCQFWSRSSTPAPRFTGPWNHTLRLPMLVVSNAYDPITPVSEGQKMSDRMGDSARHLVQNRIGHSYLVPPTECYGHVFQKYFEEGILPDDDIFCDADLLWFPSSNTSTLS